MCEVAFIGKDLVLVDISLSEKFTASGYLQNNLMLLQVSTF